MTDGSQKDPDKEIIELSEIVVGTSEEDDAIMELTEGLVDEVRNAISGATGGDQDDARQVDLSGGFGPGDDPRAADTEIIDLVDEVDPEMELAAAAETDFQELSETRQEAFEKPEDEGGEIIELTEVVESVSEEQLRAALERVVELRYGDMIDGILREVIWQKVSEDIEHLKEFLLTRKTGP
jgi:hypothetical protein